MKRYFYLLLAFALWALVMTMASCGPKTKGKCGIAASGLAMEFVSSVPDVNDALTPETDARPDNVLKSHIIRQQYLDFVFIVLYWSVFFLIIGRSLIQSPGRAAQIFGWLVCICISVAAIADIFEDVAILLALGGGQSIWPLWFGVPKWTFYFLTMGFSAALFFLRPGGVFRVTPGQGFSLLVSASGVLLMAGSAAGLIGLAMFLFACKGGGIIGLAASFTGLPVVVLLVQCYRNSRSEPALRT